MSLLHFSSPRICITLILGSFSIMGIIVSIFSILSPLETLGERVSGEVISGEAVSGEMVSGELRPRREPVVQKSGISVDAPFFFTRLMESYPGRGSSWDDASLERFVSKNIPLNDHDYKPEPLVAISGAHISEAGRTSYLRLEAREALGVLARDFYEEFKTPLVIISGYRSAAYQQRLWDLGRCTDTLCAPPGFSEHQLGLAIDVFDASTAESYLSNRKLRTYVSWLQAHAHLYGYHQSYQNGPKIDGYDIEPWHWRYLGIPLATKLKSLDMSYSEYREFENMRAFWNR